MAINWKNGNDVTIFWNDVIVKFFWRCFVSLVKFSYWTKFDVNIITGSGVMTIFFYRGFTRNLEIWNTPIWVLPNISRLGQVRDTKLGTNVSYKRLLNTAKCQGYSFYSFWVIRVKRSFKEHLVHPVPGCQPSCLDTNTGPHKILNQINLLPVLELIHCGHSQRFTWHQIKVIYKNLKKCVILFALWLLYESHVHNRRFFILPNFSKKMIKKIKK